MTKQISKQVNDDITAVFNVRVGHGYDDTVSDEIVIREIFDEDVYETPFDFMDGKIVLDIGANIGAYTIYCALGGAYVYAFEPEDDNYEALLANIKQNNVGNRVTVFKKGIYKENGTVELYQGQGASFIKGNKILPTREAEAIIKSGQVPAQNIEVITLDEAMKMIGRKVDIMKCDIEGSEYAMIGSASKNSLGSMRFITMEFHATSDVEYGKLLAKLQHTHNIHAFGNPQVGGQIIAREY